MNLSASDDQPSREEIDAALTGRFLSDQPVAEIAHVGLGASIVLLLAGLHPWQFLLLWWISLAAASAVRYGLRKRAALAEPPHVELPWSVISILVVVGLVWSAGAIPLILGSDREMLSRVMIVECGLAAAATATFEATRVGFRVFIASIYIPLIAGILAQGANRSSLTSAVLVVVFGATMLAIHTRRFQGLRSTMQLNHDLDRARRVAESNQAQVKESERRLFQFLESMPVGVLVLDPAGTVYYSNSTAKELMGPFLATKSSLDEMFNATSVYIPGTQQAYPLDRSPAVRALLGESSVDQVEAITDKGLRLIEVHGSPIHGRDGNVTYAVAVISDLSGRQNGDARRAALNAVLHVTAAATSESELLGEVLTLLNQRFTFELAEMWMLDTPSHQMVRVGSARQGANPLVDEFDRSSGHLRFALGEGLPGMVWKTAAPIWRKRTHDEDVAFRRHGGSVEAGLRTAVAVPVFVAGVTSGALVLFTREARDPDGLVTDTLMAIGAQVGSAIGRRRADAAIRAAEERYRQLVEASVDLVWEADVAGRWTFANAASARIYGLTPPELIGSAWLDRSDPGHRAADAAIFERLRKGEMVAEYETVHRRKDDSRVVISTSAAPLHHADGSVTGFHGMIRDVGDRAAARAALRAARDAAEQAATAKSAFLANMSHEIRTPMNGVLGVAELLLDTELTPDQRRSVELIANSGNSLLRIINEILDFSKIEAQQLELETVEFDLCELLEGAIRILASSTGNPAVEIVSDIASDIPERVIGDPTRVRQVLSNLLGNAIKFTTEGEVVMTVRRIASLGSAARLQFSVRDTGIGMSAETQAGIFEPFRQADSSTTRRYGGTGLGLSISRRLVELMGGELVVTSREGGGSEFSFELILPVRAHRPAPPAEELVGRRVLIVDDSATNLRVLGAMLELESCVVTSARDGTVALEAMIDAARGNTPFEIVVTDAQMPGLDGFELIRRIRADRLLRATPVVMATSGARRGDLALAAELAVASVIHKPLSRRDVRQALQAALTGAHVSGAAKPRIERSARALSVLVAEDNPINQEVARAMLTRRGHRVHIVADGRAAVHAARDGNYDVILMDIQMPEMDGIDATQEIRRFRPTAPPRIIALTANVLQGERERCLAGGMDGYLAKPFSPRDLFAILEGEEAAPPAVMPDRRPARPSGVIAIEALREDLRAAGIEESIPVLFDLFLRDGPMRIGEIESAVAARDPVRISRAAHAMKSPAGAIRATSLMSLLGTMEVNARQGDLNAAAAMLGEVVAEHEAVREAIEKGEWVRD